METFLEMPLTARVYIGAVAVAGLAVAAFGLQDWGNFEVLQFAAYLFVATLASVLKVNLPTITGTMSVNSLFILICIVQLNEGETMVIGLLGVLIQCLWRPKSNVLPVRVLFSLAANSVAISASYFVLNRQLWPASAHGIRILVVACVYFLVNTALVAGVVALTERKSAIAVWKACYFWCFPYYLGGAGVAWISTVLNRSFDWEISLSLLPVIYLIYRAYKVYLQGLEEEKRHIEDMAGLHLRTIEALAMAIEAKDHTTHDHLRRVRVYALEMGKRMGLKPLDLQSLRAAALLHDIGKLAVPEHIISKPGKLTPEEFEKMKIHPVVGAQILEQVKFPYPVTPIVLCHHEKWDGTGYPKGLKGEEIPLGSRILSAVDALDALASDRQYRRALPLDEAMQIVAAESGSAFDPAVIVILESCYVELERKAVQESGDGVRLETEPVILQGGEPATGLERGFERDEAEASYTGPDRRADESALALVARARQSAQELFEWVHSDGAQISLSETLAVFAIRLHDLVLHDAIAFYLRRDRFLVPEFVGGKNRKLFSTLRIPWGEGLSGWVAENRKPLVNGNPSVEAGYLNDPSKFSTLRSALAIPLETEAGVIGVLACYRTERDAFSNPDLRVITAMAPRIAQATAHAKAKTERIRPVEESGLLPRTGRFFLQLAGLIEVAKTQGERFSLFLIDIDNFGEINRKWGKESGDRVIRALARELKELSRQGELAAHLGGDEFALVLPGDGQENLAEFRSRMELLIGVGGHDLSKPISLSFSAGSALFPGDGSDPETIIQHAENDLRLAKISGKSAPKSVDNISLFAGDNRRFIN